MEFIQGESLSHLSKLVRKAQASFPLPIVSAIMTGVLQGLHAAHEARDERRELLHVVHRDVSPQNILVGIDGVPRVADFGIAKAAGRLQTTRKGQVKGKACYMAPEQLDLKTVAIDRRVDVFAASTVLWELLTGRRLFEGSALMQVWAQVMQGEIELPSKVAPGLPPSLDAIVMRGLARPRDERFGTALELAIALEKAIPPATVREVSEWFQGIAGNGVLERAKRIADIESASTMAVPPHGAFEPGPSKEEVVPVRVRSLDAEGRELGSGSHAEARAGGARPDAAALAPPDSVPVASQVSSISVSSSQLPVPMHRTGRARSLLWIVAAVVAVFVPAVLWTSRPHVEPARSSPAAAPPIASDPIEARAVRTDAVAPPVDPPGDPQAPGSGGAPIAGDVAPPRVRAVSSASSAASGARSAPSRAAAKRSCTPPYTIDPSGVRVPKPECF